MNNRCGDNAHAKKYKSMLKSERIVMLLIITILAVNIAYAAAPVISNPNPSDNLKAVKHNSTLSAIISDADNDTLDINFTIYNGTTWQNVRNYNNVPSGNYTASGNGLITKNYYNYTWRVTVDDHTGNIVTQTYNFTTRGLIQLRYQVNVGTSMTKGEYQLMPLMADINKDGKQEIVVAASSNLTALNAATGQVLWRIPGIEGVAIELADLNNDGTPEILATIRNSNSSLDLMAVNGNGSIRWRSRIGGLYLPMFPVLTYDINGDGYPTIYALGIDHLPDPYPGNKTKYSADYNNTLNGTDPNYVGALTKLDHNGNVLDKTWILKTCWGGLALGDPNFDGNFQLLVSDRRDAYHNIPARGLQSYDPETLELLWSRPDIQASSPLPVFADIYGSGKLEVVGTQIIGKGPIIIDPADGHSIVDYQNRGLPAHYAPTVEDLDDDGYPEVIYAASIPYDFANPNASGNMPMNFVVFDPRSGNVEFTANLTAHTTWPPKIGDVTGDGKMEIIAALGEEVDYWSSNPILIYDTATYQLIDQVDITRSGQFSPPRVFDVDGDGKNEIVVGGAAGTLYVFNTPGKTPNPAPRTWVQEYSEYRAGSPVYVDLPGPKAPFVMNVIPADNATNISANPKITISVVDFQKDKFDVSFEIYQGFQWRQLSTYNDVGNGNYSTNTSPYVTNPSTEYQWRVTLTDVKGNSKQYAYSFTTTNSIITSNPIVDAVSPENYQGAVQATELVFNISDSELMTYNVTTMPNIGSAYATGVASGQYSVPISGLVNNQDYIWRIEVNDGTGITYKEYYFSTPWDLNISIDGNGTYTTDIPAPFAHNAQINITAVPSLGNTFLGWTGNYISYANPLAIVLDVPKVLTARFRQETGKILADQDFEQSLTSLELVENRPYQDWYESRNQGDYKYLLSINDTTIGGNVGKKAKLQGSTLGNAYLTQEFLTPYNNTFILQWDVYVDNIININGAPDKAALMFIGDNVPPHANGPNYEAGRNFVWLAFYKDGGAETGTMNLVTTLNNVTEQILATNVTLDAWHTIKVSGNLITDKYDVYLDNVLVGTEITARTNKTAVTHISFAQWNDGAGTFYIDNVGEPSGPIVCVDGDSDSYNATGVSCGLIDCNDADASINPGATELCDGIDNDCSALTIDGSDEVAPVNTNQQGVCASSQQQCMAGAWINNYNITGYESDELSCDNLDNDCDGGVDESLTQPSSNQQGLCSGNYDVCELGVWNGYSGNYLPGAEICDNVLDEDCNGIADDGCANGMYPGWTYRKTIIVDHTKVSADIEGFPMLISISDTDLALKAQNDGDDILFTDSDNNKLSHEIEYYSSGQLTAWIKTDLDEDVDTILYMYYGNSTVGTQQDASNVWDTDFLTVQHFEESTGTATDSNGINNGDVLNGVIRNTNTKISKGYQFDGVNDRVVLPQVFTTQTQFTMEVWVNSTAKHGYIISQRDTSVPGDFKGAFMSHYNDSIEEYFKMYTDKGQQINVTSVQGQWRYLVGTFDGTKSRLSVNAGTPIALSGTVTWPAQPTFIGDRSALDRAFRGQLDEIRISKVVRSDDYISTSYNNQNNPSSFYIIGVEEQ